ncbi:MAG: methyltransferase domain-containing protein, partial [Polyangiaceae bacterium]|nr:methyltransferase domain-containing protein [Polyangiaceae bacterium]
MAGSSPVDALLTRLLGARLGYVPQSWPRRVHDLVARSAAAARTDDTAWLARLLGPNDSPELEALVDAATIGHTMFFRHAEQFVELAGALVSTFRRRGVPVRVWSAGCSTGEEAYSIAVTAAQVGVEVQVLATDVNPAAIRTARRGRYENLRTDRLALEGGVWTAPWRISRMVRFEVASLVGENPALGEGPFDLIFCRNVLIYFGHQDAEVILESLSEHLRPDGALVVSPADAVLPLPPSLERGTAPGWLRLSDEPPEPSRRCLSVRAETDGAGPFVALPAPDAPTPIDRAARLLGAGQGLEAETVLTELLNAEPDNIAAWF